MLVGGRYVACVCWQDQFIQLCKTMYSIFREDSKEQDLYHSIAKVASLLLELGEVSTDLTSF